MTKPTEAQMQRALLEAERDFRKQTHLMLDDYLDSLNDEGVKTIYAIMTNVIGGEMDFAIGVILNEREATEIEEHAERSGIEVVKA